MAGAKIKQECIYRLPTGTKKIAVVGKYRDERKWGLNCIFHFCFVSYTKARLVF